MSSDEQVRYSSAPATPSVYGPDDYDERGNLVRLREVPTGEYPEALKEQVSRGASDVRHVIGSPQMPRLPVEAQEAGDAPPPAVYETAARRFETKEPSKSIVAYKRPAEEGYLPEDDPDDLDRHQHVAVLSWIENRHPNEDQIVRHYIKQQQAREEGTYNPIEDPPVVLSDLVPKLVVKVSRCFSRAEAEIGVVDRYMKKLHAKHDMNMVPLECGKLQVLPVSDMTRGTYRNAALQQQMNAFYDNHERSAEGIMRRLEQDKEEGQKALLEQQRKTRLEREQGGKAEEKEEEEEEREKETKDPFRQEIERANERQEEFRERAQKPVATVTDGRTKEEIEEDKRKRKELLARRAASRTAGGRRIAQNYRQRREQSKR